MANGPVAYFSMEIALESGLPTYSGGLGVLAGDTIKAAADLGVPLVAVTLLHRKGYFFQRLVGRTQVAEPVSWWPSEWLEPTPARVVVELDGTRVAIRAWRRTVRGAGGASVQVIFLDTDLEENESQHRGLTDRLYGGDHDHRLRQEVVLGVGGVRALRALGIEDCRAYHMNEGHAALLTAELLREHEARTGQAASSDQAAAAVRALCVFTTHTPIPAGHDRFGLDQVRRITGPEQVYATSPLFVLDGELHTTHAGLSLSRFANGVSRRHGEVSARMFPDSRIEYITNGAHTSTWAAAPMAALFDRVAPGWRLDAARLEAVRNAGDADLVSAHRESKSALIRRVNRETNAGLCERDFTIGLARRATGYKRLSLIFSDPQRLAHLASVHGPIQIVMAGKAHPKDGGGAHVLHDLMEVADSPPQGVRVVFLPGYDMDLAGMLVAGSDVWLNTPERPMEASGTSGMKAAINGVPSLSILDGWWLEGCEEGVTGWAIGDDGPIRPHPEGWDQDASALYDALDRAVLPLFRADGPGWAAVMRGAISRNGPRFSAHRMVREYAARAWGVSLSPPDSGSRPAS